VEVLAKRYKAPAVKQHVAAIRMLFDFLIVGQVVGQNPAAAVRGPKHVVKPILFTVPRVQPWFHDDNVLTTIAGAPPSGGWTTFLTRSGRRWRLIRIGW
jgi:site-specific recombinase XerD